MIGTKYKSIADGLDHHGFQFSHIDFNEWVYMLLDEEQVIYYIGKSKNVKQRISDHRKQGSYVEFFFYKDFLFDVSDFAEFYFINVFKPEGNTYDVMHEKIRVDRLVRYLNRFTYNEYDEVEAQEIFKLANVPYEQYHFYDIYDLLLLVIASHENAGNESAVEQIKSFTIWENYIRDIKKPQG